MSILCGTDFTEHSARALTAAAHLAIRMQLPLHLLHALEIDTEVLGDEPKTAYTAWARNRLEQKADRLRKLGATVSVHLQSGPPDEALLSLSHKVAATLVVVAALGKRRADKWQLGGHAERLACNSHVPVLVIRQSEPFEQWVHAERPLRIVLGADLTASAETAMRWVNDLRAFGPCEVTAVHFYWPPEQFQRLGLSGVRSYLDADPTVTRALEATFTKHLAQEPALGEIAIRLEPHLGRIGDRLATFADDHKADLVVVGTHGRSGFARWREGSVSSVVLHHARTSIVCVPTSPDARARHTPKVQSVLVATDFSEVGNCAIPLAYAVANPGAVVHLVHVITDPTKRLADPHDIFAARESPEHDALQKQLLSLMPKDTLAQDKASRLYVLESNDPAAAICQAAERLDVDVLCLGTHGRSGLSKTVLGSVAQAVLAHSHRPLLLARKPAA